MDDDLIFCTNCGGRLFESAAQPANESNEAFGAQTSSPDAKKDGMPGWVKLAVILLAVPVVAASLFLLLRKSDAPQTVQNTVKPPAPARKSNSRAANQATNNSESTGNANQTTVSNSNQTNENTDADLSDADNISEPVEIFNERIEIAPGEHIARPFKLDSNAKLTGELQTVQGAGVQGYVYFQEQYDEHFPDATYKVFSFEGDDSQINQTLVPQNYVLIFLNQNDSATTIKGKFSVAPVIAK